MRELHYDERIELYNSERRVNVSPAFKRGIDPNDEHSPVSRFDFSNASVNHFIGIDLSNASELNPVEVPVFTYSNGITAYLALYCSHETNDYYNIVGSLKHKYNNEYVNPYPESVSDRGIGFLASKERFSSLSSIDFYYCASLVEYDQGVDVPLAGTDPTYYRIGNVYCRKDDEALFPQLNQEYTYNFLLDYYSISTSIGMSHDEFNEYLEGIIENGDGTPITPILPSEDTSTTGGGDDANPQYDPFSDPVDFPGLPTGGGAIESGFIRVYSPTSGQLQALAGKLWGNDFINTIHKIMNDPMEAMISLHSVPFQIVGGANANIEIGNFNTEVSAKTVTTQYYTLDCGNISLPEHWASALDYSPYTTVDIFIPFVGVRPLQIDDVMNKVLNLKYNIDVLTGSAVAMLKCGDSVLYTYNTQVHSEIPYTMSSYGRLIQSIIGVAGTAIGATAGGAGAIVGGAIGGALGTAITKHSDISRGGSLGGAVGVMGDFTPYLIIHRPIQSLASDFASKKGYPSNITATLSSVSGYTVVDKIHLTNIDCTDTERDEIHALLKEGVIV